MKPEYAVYRIETADGEKSDYFYLELAGLFQYEKDAASFEASMGVKDTAIVRLSTGDVIL